MSTLRSYETFSIEDITLIGGVPKKIARIVYAKINGKYYAYEDAVEDTERVLRDCAVYDAETPESEKFGITLGDELAWEAAVEREQIREKVHACHRKLKTWRRKERSTGSIYH